MLVWFLLFGVVLQMYGGLVTSMNICWECMCHNYTIEQRGDKVELKHNTTEQCHQRQGCYYEWIELLDFTHYLRIETARCHTWTDPYNYDHYDGAFRFQFLKSGTKHQHYCTTEFCNAKDGPLFKKLEAVRKLAGKTQEMLIKKGEKQRNETLYCDDWKKGNTSCDTYCSLFREANQRKKEKREASCVPEHLIDAADNRQKLGVALYYSHNHLDIVITINCFHSNCNSEGSTLDKFVAEVWEIVSEDDTPSSMKVARTTVAPKESTGFFSWLRSKLT